MGSTWKMFTKTQGDELKNGTKYNWTTMNGVNGVKFTSKTDSSKYIFLPAGGQWNETGLSGAGTWGYYWTNNYYSLSNGPRMLRFSSGIVTTDMITSGYVGTPVRAIQ